MNDARVPMSAGEYRARAATCTARRENHAIANMADESPDEAEGLVALVPTFVGDGP